jgi:hypothetical protein
VKSFGKLGNLACFSTVLPPVKNVITPDSKNFNAYSPLTCEFLNRIGLRPDELRDKLEKTFEKFSGKFEMMI